MQFSTFMVFFHSLLCLYKVLLSYYSWTPLKTVWQLFSIFYFWKRGKFSESSVKSLESLCVVSILQSHHFGQREKRRPSEYGWSQIKFDKIENFHQGSSQVLSSNVAVHSSVFQSFCFYFTVVGKLRCSTLKWYVRLFVTISCTLAR